LEDADLDEMIILRFFIQEKDVKGWGTSAASG
jgi:hypothetical protein